jgi:hypothetical protein
MTMALPTMRAKLFDEREIEQIQWLAKQYKSRPHRQTIPNQDFSAIVKDNDEFSRLIERMQSLGVIDSLNSGGVILNDGILDVERNLAIAVKEATKPPDRIDQFYRWCRRHWATAKCWARCGAPRCEKAYAVSGTWTAGMTRGSRPALLRRHVRWNPSWWSRTSP